MNERTLVLALQKYLHEPSMFNKIEDACFFRIPDTHFVIVANIDNLTWKTDVIPEIMTEQDVGSKIVAITCSDLAAKGINPLFFMSCINFPPDWSENQILAIANGIKITTEEYNIKYLGGDLGRADEFILTGTAIGVLNEKEGRALPRSGAQPSNIICVTGLFGLTGLFYQLYFNKEFEGLLNSLPPIMIDKIKRPSPKIHAGSLLSKNEGITSCIDSSDGLAISLWELAEQSNCQIVINKPPLTTEILPYCEKYNFSWEKCVFEGGEEYELIFTVQKGAYESIERILAKSGIRIYPIGLVREGQGVFYNSNPLNRKGWDAGQGNWASLKENMQYQNLKKT